MLSKIELLAMLVIVSVRESGIISVMEHPLLCFFIQSRYMQNTSNINIVGNNLCGGNISGGGHLVLHIVIWSQGVQQVSCRINALFIL